MKKILLIFYLFIFAINLAQELPLVVFTYDAEVNKYDTIKWWRTLDEEDKNAFIYVAVRSAGYYASSGSWNIYFGDNKFSEKYIDFITDNAERTTTIQLVERIDFAISSMKIPEWVRVWDVIWLVSESPAKIRAGFKFYHERMFTYLQYPNVYVRFEGGY